MQRCIASTAGRSVVYHGERAMRYFYQIKKLGSGPNVSIALFQALDLMACPTIGASQIQCFGKTPQDQAGLVKLVELWKGIGCPCTGFWRETRVFYCRVIDSTKL
jgi:hypothetical protein